MRVVQLDTVQAGRLQMGQAVPVAAEAPDPGLARLYGPGGLFLGIGRIEAGLAGTAVAKPVRLFNDLGQIPT
jgi:Pseudouridine synthase II TruB, C-terminal